MANPIDKFEEAIVVDVTSASALEYRCECTHVRTKELRLYREVKLVNLDCQIDYYGDDCIHSVAGPICLLSSSPSLRSVWCNLEVIEPLIDLQCCDAHLNEDN